MAVRSARLFAGSTGVVGVTTTLYTCPAGITALLKDLRVDSPVGGTTRVIVWLESGGAQVALVDEPLGDTEVIAVQGFMVLEPGDQLRALATGASARVWASGAELVGVA